MKLREIILNKLAGFNIYELREANEKYILHLQGQIDEQNVTIQTLRNEVKTQKNEVRRLTSKIDETDNIFKYWSAKVDALQSKLKTKESENNELQSIIDEKEKTNTESLKELGRRIFELKQQLEIKNSHASKNEKNLELKARENEKLNNEIANAKAQIEELKAELTRVSRQANAYKLNYTRAKQAKDEIGNKLSQAFASEESLKQALQSKEQEYVASCEHRNMLISEIQALQAKIAEQEAHLNSKEQELSQVNIALLHAQEQTAQNKAASADDIRELENQIQNLNEQQFDYKREIAILKDNLKQKDDEINKIGLELSESEKLAKSLQIQFDEAKYHLKEKENEIRNLHEQIEHQKEQIEKLAGQTPPVTTTTPPIKVPEAKTPTEITVAEPKGTATTIIRKSPVKHKSKTKVEEVIMQSDGAIQEFPPITNDSNRHVNRSIEYVFDSDNKKIKAEDFFEGTAEEIAQKSRQLAEAHITGKIDFVCGMCHRPVKIAHRTFNGTESLFFAHTNRNEYCPWVPLSTTSRDEFELVEETEGIDEQESGEEKKPHSRELKELIFSLLCTSESEAQGISDVKCDAIIKSSIPYMKWRRPDISFRYKSRDVVIVLQRKSHDIGTIVDRDVFFRLNNCHVIWIFGADNDVSYEYMRKSNYKNTMFDCHRNVFVFDVEAQKESEKRQTLCLKYNWLDENDCWAINLEKSGSNGLIADISKFIFDDEYCKPFIVEANEPYFNHHPEAKERYLEAFKTREELLEELEKKWKGEPSYDEALRFMKLRSEKASPFQYMSLGLWGFRYNTTTLIQPIFTEEPIDLGNGYFMVKQGETVGLVNYQAESVMDWTILRCEKLDVDSKNKRVLFFQQNAWGVADFNGVILINPIYSSIKPWTDGIYRVNKSNLWGLCDIEDNLIANCIYEYIGSLDSDNRAEAKKRDEYRSWISYIGRIDIFGNEVDTQSYEISNQYIAFERFEKWGIRSAEDEELIVQPQYQAIKPWTNDSVRVQSDGRWGILRITTGEFIIDIKYNSISELSNGVAHIVLADVTYNIDKDGNILSEEAIELNDGFVKSKKGGKWGIIKDAQEIVPHKYDEIGSFRQRLIGVMNGKIFKLNAYYDYPILITGKCYKIDTKSVIVEVVGVKCSLSKALLKTLGLESIKVGQTLSNIAFGNLLFSQGLYLLRFVSKEQMNKKTSHGDKDSDFQMSEIVTGSITDIMRYKYYKGIRTTKVKITITDGRESMIPRRFFAAAGLKIDDFKKGDIVKIQKIGFDDELDQTNWKILNTKHI